ncbi:hypothetical protein KY290_014969 [Solanum tuberosum]|uniref:Uncharacterized protein n=1 Tax=Solanum tuberosum TaxID=4113 RepID=A0ABQ7VRB1_SOLTU|nr:hypothetical protein KY290_014969 [Solanum tuberosum]
MHDETNPGAYMHFGVTKGSVGGFEQFWGPNRIGVFPNAKSVAPLFSPTVVEFSATSTEYVRFNEAAIMDEALSSDNRTQAILARK